jgi:DNA-binding NarL/FixJ family response regulator
VIPDDGRRCPWRPDQRCPYVPIGKDAAIVRLVALGWSDRGIGRELGFSHHTVSHRIGRLCRMLGLHEVGDTGSSARRIRLAAWAGAHNMTGPPA